MPARLILKRRSKYRNTPCVVEGVRFDSQKEARHWVILQGMEKSGAIELLRRQVPFDLIGANGTKVGKYVADFTFQEVATGRFVVMDVKSPATRTQVYKIKKLLLAAQGLEIVEI